MIILNLATGFTHEIPPLSNTIITIWIVYLPVSVGLFKSHFMIQPSNPLVTITRNKSLLSECDIHMQYKAARTKKRILFHKLDIFYPI